MRHRKSNKSLGRTSSHRKAMFKNMAVSMFQHEQIQTTVVKAKELRRIVEPMITMARKDSLHARRLAFARLGDRKIVQKLFADIAPFYKNRPGGYLRVLKCGNRSGDNAPMAIIELVGRKEESAA